MKYFVALFLAAMSFHAAASPINCDEYNNSRDQFSIENWKGKLQRMSILERIDFIKDRREVLKQCQLDDFSRVNVENSVKAASILLEGKK
ncbi:hypothetical protein [Chromobacterium aquaticum]|uniref:Uncharacterized protein n=1 Tax=Chromobacterium aquaticum TaxID=467180 RepID=A0ABV8ZV41_9NEIS|nr:hypothetical protein [Chromobacterium aquaticum]MCD5362553.1 hypothetical protein [Chromobacterium aquaticum]